MNRGSIARLLPRRREGEEVLAEALRVVPHQLLDPLRVRRLHDQPDMVLLVIHAPDDLWIVVRGSIRLLLPRQRYQQTSGVTLRSWQLVWRLTPGNLDLRPLPPHV